MNIGSMMNMGQVSTPQKLLNQSGITVWSATYDAFGRATVDPSSTITNNLRLPGQYADQETGLHYNWNRYYSARDGRYITSDPIGLRGGKNLYTYVGGNPTRWFDANGLLCTFSQSGGNVSCTGGMSGDIYYQASGYAGLAFGKNNPEAQDIPFFGPLPRGCYRVGKARNGGHTGKNSLPLTPLFSSDNSNSFRDLNSFFIHGESRDPERRGKSSNGCPILPPSRTKIKEGEIFCVTE